MLERKRKQTMTFEMHVSQESKKKRIGITDCVTAFPEALSITKTMETSYLPLVSERSTNVPKYDVDNSAVSVHHQMKDSGYRYIEMDVDLEYGKGNGSSPCHKPRAVPNCAKCAAGQGGHISHLLN